MKKKSKYETPFLVDMRGSMPQGACTATCNQGINVTDCGSGSCVEAAMCNTGPGAGYCYEGNLACSACATCCQVGTKVYVKGAGTLITDCYCLGGSTPAYYCGGGNTAVGLYCGGGANVDNCSP